jgi:hypothetical protein
VSRVVQNRLEPSFVQTTSGEVVQTEGVLLSIVLQNEYACAGFETKNIPPIVTDVHKAVVITRTRIVAGFIVLQNTVTIICIYRLRHFLLSFD